MQSQVEIILRQLTVACFPYYPSTISWCNLIHHLHDIFANEESKALVGSLMESLSSHEMKKLQRVIKATAPWMKLLEEMMSKGKIVPVINISLCLGLLEEVHWQVQQVMREKDTDNEEEVEFYAWYESKSLMLLHPFTRIVEQFFPKDANEEDSEILRGEYNRLQLLSLAEILDPTVSPSTLIAQQRTWDDVETRLTSIAKVKHAHITTSSASSSSSSTKELSNNVTNSTSKKRKATSDSAAEDVFSSSSLDNKEAGEQSLADKETVSTSSDEVHIHKKGKENEVVEPAVVSENSNKEVPCVTPVPVDSDSSDDSQSVEDKAESIPMPTNAEAEPSSVIPTESEFASIMALRELGYYRQRFYAHSFENNVDDDEVEEVDADLIIPEETSAGRKTGSHSGRMRMTTSDSFKTLAYNYNREPPKSAIAFWRDWEVRMPLLASLARSILCVPVMSLTHTLHSSYQLGQNAFARNPQIMSEMMLLHDVWTQLHDQSSLRTKIRFNSPISSNQPPSMSQPYLTSNSYPSIVFTNSSQTRASIGANHINGLLNDPQSSIDRLVASTSTNNEAV